MGLIEGPARRRDVRIEAILQDEMVLIVRSGYPWDQGQPIALQDLSSMLLLTRERGSGSRHVIELALAKVGVPARDLRVLMELDTTEAIKAAARSPGWASASFRAGASGRNRGSVRFVP